SRKLLGQNPSPESATFVMEAWKANSPEKKSLSVPPALGLLGNQVGVHRGKHASHQAFLEFGFDASGLDMETVEHRAREVAKALGKTLPTIDPMFAQAGITQLAWETSVTLQNRAVPQPKLSGHHIIGDTPVPLDCGALSAIKEKAEQFINSLGSNTYSPSKFTELAIVGATIPAQSITLSEVDEPGLAIPLKRCNFDTGLITARHDCQVFVAG